MKNERFAEFLTVARRNLPWVALIVVLVLVMPAITFVRNQTLRRGGDAARPAMRYEEPVSAGTVYQTERLFSLEIGEGSREIALMEYGQGLDVPSFEMAAVSPDGSLIWIADHPVSANGKARIRAFDLDGTVVSDFTVPGATTLYTPGVADDVWMDRSSSAGGSGETLLRYSADGKRLGTYPLPPKVLARSILPAQDGRVFVLTEEWLIDPDTLEAVYRTNVVPIVAADGKPVENPLEAAEKGSFLSPDGRVWRADARGPRGTELPTYSARPATPTADSSRSVTFPQGFRPYAVDDSGALYAESATPKPLKEAPGITSLGDAAGEDVTVEVVAPGGDTSRLRVERQGVLSVWAPAAWPTADGLLISTRWRDGAMDVLLSSPTSVTAPTADAKPGRAQARILVAAAPPGDGDPYMALDARERDLFGLVYSGLVSMDASLQPVPDLAVEVPRPGAGVSEDGRTVTWRIRDGSTWHDGRLVTAADVVATFEYLKCQTAYSRPRPFPGFELIDSVRADGDAVVVRLSEPFGAAPEAFFPFVLPAHIVAPDGVPTVGLLSTKPVGSGPYALARWESRGRWLLKAHTDPRVKPKIERMDVHFVNAETARDDFMASGVPTVWSWIGQQDTEALERDAFGEIVSAHTGRWFGLVANTRVPITSDDRARRALLETYPLEESLKYHAVPETATVALFARSERSALPLDVAKGESAVVDAKRLLRDAGWRDADDDGLIDSRGEPVEAVYAQTFRSGIHEIISEVGDLLIPTWEKLGTKSSWAYGQPAYYASAAHDGYLTGGQHIIGAGVFPGYPDPGWGSVFDPADTPGWSNLRGTNVTFIEDAGLKRLHRQARASYDASERARLGDEILDRVKELDVALVERPELRESALLGLAGYSPGPYPAGEFWNAKDWTVVTP